MDPPFPAYEGHDPFLFVCYSHANSERVYPSLESMHQSGVNFWYDEGIEAGMQWRDALADAIDGCEGFVFFISRDSIASEHCLNEVNYAVEQQKKSSASIWKT